MQALSDKENKGGRIPKKIEFEKEVFRKAKAIIRIDTRRPRPSLKMILSEAIEAEHARRFTPANGRAA